MNAILPESSHRYHLGNGPNWRPLVFFFPYATDAPIYHPPIGTILLIVANVVCFQLTGHGDIESDLTNAFMLEFGEGLHPLEWISCHFLHFGWMHLLGNMFFLYIYGLIIEGKIGTIPFLGLYFVICWVGASLAQALVLWGQEAAATGAGGASIAVFGLMMISFLWAPRNEISFVGAYVLMIVPRVVTFEVTVLWVGFWYFTLNLFVAWLEEFTMGTALAHVLGGVIGAGLGALLLKLDWVDCEGWDVFSLMSRDPTKKSLAWYKDDEADAYVEYNHEVDRPGAAIRDTTGSRKKDERLVSKFRTVLAEGNRDAVFKSYEKIRSRKCENLFEWDDLDSLVKFLIKHREWDEAMKLLEQIIVRFPDRSSRHELKLCELFLVHRKHPAEALHRLAEMEFDEWDEKITRGREKLIARAEQMMARG